MALTRLTAASGAVIFPDAGFEAAVRKILGKPAGAILVPDVARIKTLDVQSRQIADLTGIEYFTALESLFAGGNQMTALDVSHNAALTRLDVWGNRLTVLNVRHNPLLEQLCAEGNRLGALDVSCNLALEYLDVSNNRLTELYVGGNAALTELFAGGNRLTALDIRRNPALARLYVCQNQMGLDPAVSVPAWTKSPALDRDTYDGGWKAPLFFYFPQDGPEAGR
ncbi:MAG: hypothetical protein FWG72_04415 [Oscillospiraceae bacterium]|nr:hypothetical protein [Oscillospiraceae bacterium]